MSEACRHKYTLVNWLGQQRCVLCHAYIAPLRVRVDTASDTPAKPWPTALSNPTGQSE